MELIFDIVSYHRLSPEQNSKISISNTLTLGRSESNDWHLPDPEKVVSGSHARVEKKVDGFYIYDLSTNGLYINRSVEALGQSNSHKLCEGDLLTFGDYEVSVSFANAQVQSTPSSIQPTPVIDSKPTTSTPVQGISPNALFDDNIAGTRTTQNSPLVANDLNDHFDVPQAIPEEWGADFLGTPSQAYSPVEEIAVANSPSQTTKTVSLNHEPLSQVQSEIKPQPLPSKPSVNVASFDSFIKGLGVKNTAISEEFTDELLFEMGQGMQLMLMGLVDSLRNRTALKNEFRINQTTFQQQENNPLKFSATIDDVFQNLFLKRSSSFLPSTKAITEAFNDTKKHDIALTAGTLGAIEGVFNQLAPSEIEKKDLKESVFDQVIPGQKQLRYWKMYQSLHKDMVNEITAHGSSALSDDFVRAYDKKIKSL